MCAEYYLLTPHTIPPPPSFNLSLLWQGLETFPCSLANRIPFRESNEKQLHKILKVKEKWKSCSPEAATGRYMVISRCEVSPVALGILTILHCAATGILRSATAYFCNPAHSHSLGFGSDLPQQSLKKI